MFDADSALVDAVKPAINFTQRREGKAPSIIVLHYTGMPDAGAALNWLCAGESGVSCHYFVFEDGRINQLVSESKRAWHAGQSCWQGERDINSASIGIEISNPGHEHGYVPFPDAQMDRVVALVNDIAARHSIPRSRILAHSDIAPARKQDPGELFNWNRLHAGYSELRTTPDLNGIGEVVLDKAINADACDLLTQMGFEPDAAVIIAGQSNDCVAAFQRHYRQQKVDGLLDRSTFSTLTSVVNLLKYNA